MRGGQQRLLVLLEPERRGDGRKEAQKRLALVIRARARRIGLVSDAGRSLRCAVEVPPKLIAII